MAITYSKNNHLFEAVIYYSPSSNEVLDGWTALIKKTLGMFSVTVKWLFLGKS